MKLLIKPLSWAMNFVGNNGFTVASTEAILFIVIGLIDDEIKLSAYLLGMGTAAAVLMLMMAIILDSE